MRVAALLALIATAGLGLSGCGGQSDEAKKKAKQELAQAQAQIDQERGQAQSDVAEAEAKVSDANDKLAEKKAQIERAQQRLDRLRSEAQGAQATIDRNTIPGTGTFEVGKDIDPGTYRAEAKEGCYWARLNSLDTSDIADNDNADGPVVVEIQSSDRAFQASNCADFHKAG
jgi:multidrug efflux pump subunit AcrA (membrane-fusion protein)